MNLHFFVLLAQLSFSSQPFRVFSLIFHSDLPFHSLIICSGVDQVKIILIYRTLYCPVHVGHAKALGSTYDVIICHERPKMAEVDHVILVLVLISLMTQVCIHRCRILCSFLCGFFLNKDLKYCALLIREMGKMQVIWEFFTSKELKIGKIFVSLTIQCGRPFQRILMKR